MSEKKRNQKLLLIVTLLILAVILAACGSGGQKTETSGDSTASLSTASTAGLDNSDRGLKTGDLAPDFLMTFADDENARLSDWRGQPVVINFWASWCGPCRAEMPGFVNAYQRYEQDGLVILGVNAQESEDKATAFMQEMGMSFPVTLDSRGEIMALYQVRGLPTTFFINAEGRIAGVWAGLLTEGHLSAQLAETM